MNEKVETGKMLISSLLAALTIGLEDNMSGRLLIILLVFMLFDTLLGWAKAGKSGKWKSYKARWGVLGKLFELGFIAVAYGLDWVFGTDMIKLTIISYFCLVEIGSMLENAHEIGVPIPKAAVGMATDAKHFVGWFLVKRLEGIFAAAFKMDYKDMKQVAQEEKEKEVKEEIKEE